MIRNPLFSCVEIIQLYELAVKKNPDYLRLFIWYGRMSISLYPATINGIAGENFSHRGHRGTQRKPEHW
jgi:hypothetical protein